MKRNKKIELYVLYIATSISGLISLFDLFGFLDEISWLHQRILTLTLLMVCLTLGHIISGVTEKLDAIETLFLDMRTRIELDTIAKIISLRKQLDPNLEIVFGEHVSELLTNVEKALKEQQIQFHDVDLHRYFFKRTLNAYSRAVFFATSLPYERFFWKNKPMEQAMTNFIARGGKIRRIFFIKNQEELNIQEVRDILYIQYNTGIEVFITDATHVPSHLKRFFLVEAKGRIAWESFIGPGERINNIIATSSPESIKNYLRLFDELLALSGTHRYTVTNISRRNEP